MLCPLLLLAVAQPPAAPPPGWVRYAARDKAFEVFLPAGARPAAADRTLPTPDGPLTLATVTAKTRDGLTLTVGVADPPGSDEVKLHELAAAADRTDKYAVGDFTPTTAGGRPAVWYAAGRSAPGTKFRRVLAVSGRPRAYLLTVTADALTPAFATTAETLFGSLKLPGGPGPKPAGGLAWTLDVAKLTPPDAPAAGRVLGVPFVARSAIWYNGSLNLYSGPDADEQKDDVVALLLGRSHKVLGEVPAGRTLTAAPKAALADRPLVIVKMPSAPKSPRRTLAGPVAVRVEFGELAGDKLPGKVYLCCDDPDKTVVAGTFEAKVLK